MPALGFPRPQLGLLHDLASRLLDSRKLGSDDEAFARDLLVGFFDVCMRAGLDGVLVELAQAFPPLDITDRFALSEHPRFRPALVEKIRNKAEFDERGPRNAKPRQLADCLVAVLSLTLTDEPDRSVTLGDDVRSEITAAMASVVDVELAVPQIREAVIAKGRELSEARYLAAFEKISAQLDDRGMRMIRQPKVALDAVQAVQQVLFEARRAVIARVAHAAIDRARQALARSDADAAARIDLPITHRLTPRDVAIARVSEARASKEPAAVVQSLLESLSELARLAWRAVEPTIRAYSAVQTFAVGDHLEHPKFGRGVVISCAAQRIEVEFADGPHTLVHVRAGK